MPYELTGNKSATLSVTHTGLRTEMFISVFILFTCIQGHKNVTFPLWMWAKWGITLLGIISVITIYYLWF